jgi:hypothetical protein
MNDFMERDWNGSHQPLRLDWRIDPTLWQPVLRIVRWLGIGGRTHMPRHASRG